MAHLEEDSPRYGGGATLSHQASACSVLSPSLLLQGRMLRHDLYSMIHVPHLKAANAAELFLVSA